MLASALLFTVVYNASSFVFFRLSATYRHLPAKLQLRWDNRVASTLHALIIVPGCLHAFFFAYDTQNLTPHTAILGCNSEAMVWACVSAGYFTWDSLTYLLYVAARRTDDVEVGEFVHAFVCWLAYLLTMSPFVQYYAMFFLAYELSTPFVNFHWFMDKYLVPNSNPIKLLNGILLVVCFFLARIAFGFYYSYAIVRDLYIVAADNIAAHGPWSLNVSAVTISLIILTMCVLNSHWFFLIISFVQKKPRTTKKKE